MSLKRERSGNMILRFRTAGRGSKLHYYNLGPITRDEAKTRAAEIQAEARRNLALADPAITFRELYESWLRLKTPDLKRTTLVSSATTLARHAVPVLGEIRVCDFLPVTLESYRAARLAADKPPARSSLNHELALIRWVLSWGAQKGIVRNPIPPRSIKALKVEQKTTYFSPTEWRAFIDAAEGDEKLRAAAPLWRLKLLTASRISEMVDLCWGDISYERHIIAIRQRKTGRTKALTLTKEMEAVLKSVTQGIGAATVFRSPEGTLWGFFRLRRYFEKTLEVAGLVGPWTPHSIRHTGATWARKAGTPLDRVAKMLGHAGLGQVERYAHFDVEDLNPALDAVSAMERRGGERAVNENAVPIKPALTATSTR